MLDSRLAFHSSTKGAGIRSQNTSSIQMLLRHFDVSFVFDGHAGREAELVPETRYEDDQATHELHYVPRGKRPCTILWLLPLSKSAIGRRIVRHT